jgi:hypothetical protein
MTAKLDHIIIGCRDLNADQAAVAMKLGMPPAARGKHDMMGTHNALWNMGDFYIELVAIDPGAPDPGRPRWFGLDDPGMQARLAGGPRLINWAVSTDDAGALAARAPVALGPVESFARSDLRWKVAVPADGLPGKDGAYPLTIQWTEGLHPARRLPDMGFRCEGLDVTHPDAALIAAALGAVEGPVSITEGPAALTCRVARSDGQVLVFD